MYQVTPLDIYTINKKLDAQKEYLDCYNLTSYSANINPKRYFAELNNRVNTLVSLSLQRSLIPVFLTITLPSRFHPSSKKYDGFSTVTDGARFLSKIFKIFLNHRVLDNTDYEYIRVFEPHKSGVPHLHALFFIEAHLRDRFTQAFTNLMKKYGFKRVELKFDFDEKKQFIKPVAAIVAYIMKYLNKSFRNAKTGKMDEITYWYIKFKIRRLTMSRSLVPLFMYRKSISFKKLQNMYFSTFCYNQAELFFNKNKSKITWLCFDNYDMFDKDLCCHMTVWQKPFDPKKVFTIKYKKPKAFKKIYFVHFEKEGVTKVYNPVTKTLTNIPLYSSRMSDFKLYKYFMSLDPENENITLLHYGIVKNECVKRGLIKGNIESLNNFNTDFR